MTFYEFLLCLFDVITTLDEQGVYPVHRISVLPIYLHLKAYADRCMCMQIIYESLDLFITLIHSPHMPNDKVFQTSCRY